MSDVVIRTEKLGKKYIIGHQVESERYTALRDVIMRNAGTLRRKTRDLIGGRPIIQGDNLEEVWALKDVDLEIRQGETVGIIGRNGAGKSTLLKILSRITEPSAGRVEIKGRVTSLLEVGTGFHPELTGRENIYLNGAILGMGRAEIRSKFDEIVAFAEVEQYLDTPVKRYSSGMYVRLAFAVAAHLESEVLLIDEVLAVGDAAFHKKCLERMGFVATQGRTVLFVSHQMHMIVRLCKWSALLHKGHVTKVGTTANLVEEYLAQEMVTATDEVDLSYRPRPSHVTGRAKLLKARLLADMPVVFGFPLEIELEFEIIASISYVECSIMIRTPEGSIISSLASGDSRGPILRDPEIGRVYKVLVHVAECRWLPRLYCLDAGLRSASFGGEDYVEIGVFEVAGDTNDPSCFEKRWDVFRPGVSWSYGIH